MQNDWETGCAACASNNVCMACFINCVLVADKLAPISGAGDRHPCTGNMHIAQYQLDVLQTDSIELVLEIK